MNDPRDGDLKAVRVGDAPARLPVAPGSDRPTSPEWVDWCDADR